MPAKIEKVWKMIVETMSVFNHQFCNNDAVTWRFIAIRQKKSDKIQVVYDLILPGSKKKLLTDKNKTAMTVVKFNNKPANGFSFLENFFNEIPTVFKDDFASNQKGFIPVNVKETKDAYQLEVVAPGFEKNDFKINLEKDLLTISAEKKNEQKNESEKQVRREYEYRSIKRSFTIDENIDAEKIDAKYINGVLTLNLPRKAEVKASAKEISVL